jgi:signal transduction histidine kinase
MKREKLEIAYSIVVFITIPLIVIVNTVLLLNITRKNVINNELRRKADLVNTVIAQSSLDSINSKEYEIVQENLQGIEDVQPAVMQSSVIIEKDGELSQIAQTKSSPKQLNNEAKTQISVAIDNKQSIARLINITDRKGKPTQAWNVATPVLDEKDKVVAVVTTSTLTSDTQEAINKAYQVSFMVLLASVALIFALLFRHLRMVSYVSLLAKQKEINQTMADFLSVATHELKAPTTIIKGYLSNVMDGIFGPIDDRVRDQLTTALAQTDRLNSLVQDLLNVSRVEQGRISYTYTSVDTNKLLTIITNNYTPIATNKGLSINFRSDLNTPLIKADEGRMQEVFTNLIDNAIKYTATGSVTITQRVEKNSVITNIRDTGFGMSPEARKRLFQRFYRIKTAETQNIAGTGLGLWIIKQYLEAMGGSIDLETMEGVGTNFIVVMPIDKSAPKSEHTTINTVPTITPEIVSEPSAPIDHQQIESLQQTEKPQESQQTSTSQFGMSETTIAPHPEDQ